ncbi:MAG: hypothetical protein LBP53_03845 [Candidatus Peribacteria bacterium]|jgi:hypothetical protein|nr:hypothetical protein [Candidatus Peribacteria bacterium]
MYLTTKSFYQHYLSSLPATELFSFLQIIATLLQTYGVFKLKTPAFLQVLKRISPELYTLLTLLMQHQKLTKSSLTALKTLVATQIDMTELHFTISSPSENIQIQLEKQLKKQFKKSDFSFVLSPEMGLKVQGGRISYERNLEKDLKKMFEM